MTGESCINGWVEALGSLDYEVRVDAKKHLLDFGVRALEPLIAAVQAANGRQCWEAAYVLAKIDDPRVARLMCELLRSPNIILTQIAAQALGRYGEQSIAVLVRALPMSSELTQIEIVSALEAIGSRRAVLPLLEFLRTTSSATLRYTTIQALGRLGDPQAIELIRSFQNDEDSHVCKRVRAALQALENSAQA
ncbi:MAG: HEAT repeat domain-containing protein [Chloroflexota bacterium]